MVGVGGGGGVGDEGCGINVVGMSKFNYLVR